ncbi:hypothetical protein NDU88_004367 [Pleurodeles waltl]|uniref:Uncharacterized protein n=1 Tax=Pleurodeles waltl TaxID=8319 RepID=A0AAV7V119_PLEWA|nr:hypothetical protein NDU88_004367 [Pleurodeles waltl]
MQGKTLTEHEEFRPPGALRHRWKKNKQKGCVSRAEERPRVCRHWKWRSLLRRLEIRDPSGSVLFGEVAASHKKWST